MIGAFIIVFREAIEAGLIVGIVLAATRGVPGRVVWIAAGAVAGIAGAVAIAAAGSGLADLFQGRGEELLNASILFFAVVMLTWHNVWMSAHGRQLAEDLKRTGADVAAGRRTLSALSVVVGVAVLREGAEVVLFLYGIAVQGGASTASMLAGGAFGLLGGAGVSALMYLGMSFIPMRRLFHVTSGLIVLLAAGMASQAVLYLQNAGFLQFWLEPVWDASWLLPDEALLGKMLRTLIGYTDRPDGLQLFAYGFTVLTIVILMRAVHRTDGPGRHVATQPPLSRAGQAAD